MTVSNDEKNLIMNLILSCNELIEGKFILADSKISKILKDITESKEVYNLLTECMTNFNFDKEFARAKIKLPTKPSYFKMPEEKYKILPMVFCILVDIENRKIDFPIFLREYFKKDDSETPEYKNFINDVVKPFRNAISEIFDLPLIINERMQKIQTERAKTILTEDDREEEKVDEQQEKLFEDVYRIVGEIISTVESDFKLKEEVRDNAIIMLNGILKTCEYRDLKLLNALLIGFEYVGGGIKSIRFVYNELKERMVEYFSSL